MLEIRLMQGVNILLPYLSLQVSMPIIGTSPTLAVSNGMYKHHTCMDTHGTYVRALCIQMVNDKIQVPWYVRASHLWTVSDKMQATWVTHLQRFHYFLQHKDKNP